MEEYLDSFVSRIETFPSTIMLFRDQTHLGLTADILRKSYFLENKSQIFTFRTKSGVSITWWCKVDSVSRSCGFKDIGGCFQVNNIED